MPLITCPHCQVAGLTTINAANRIDKVEEVHAVTSCPSCQKAEFLVTKPGMEEIIKVIKP